MTLLSGALAVIGALGLAAQVVLFREFFGIFGGNELSAGIFLSGWLLFEGLGAWLAGRYASRLGTRLPEWFIGVGLVSGLATVASVLLVILTPRLAGLIPGEVLSLPQLLILTFLLVLLPAGTHGALFVLAAERFVQFDGQAGVARAYGYEGLGTFLAGLVLYFLLLSRLSGVGIVLLFAGLVLLVLALSISRRNGAGLIMVAGSLLLVLAPALGDRLGQALIRSVWRGYQVLEVRESAYGKLVTLEREGRRQVLYNGSMVLEVPRSDIVADEQLAGLPLLIHQRPEDVLILGAGAIGVVNEALKFPVARVRVVELDPELVEEIRRAGGQLVAGLMADPRLQLINADPRNFIYLTRDSFDVIILPSAAPQNLNANRLYSVEFFRRCAERLKDGGIVVTRLPGGGDRPVFETGMVAGIRQATLRQAFSRVQRLGLDIPLMIASRESLEISPAAPICRLRSANSGLTVLTTEYLERLLDTFRQRRFESGVINSGLVNQDWQPVELFYNLVRESRRASAGSAGLLLKLPQIIGKIKLPLLLIMLLVVAAGSLLRSGFARGFGIMSSGFAGAGISTLTIMIYQVRFGSVYSGVALLLAGFMLGTVVGAFLSNRPFRIHPAWSFLGGEVVLLGVLVMIWRLLYGGAPVLFVFTQLVAGMCLGWQFGVASAERQREFASGGKTAGLFSVLDFSGGAVGGFIVAVLLVPVAGIVNTILVLGVLKLSSALGQLLTLVKSRFTIERG